MWPLTSQDDSALFVEDRGNKCDRLRETERRKELRTGQNLRDLHLAGWAEEEEPVEELVEDQPER